MNLVISGHHMAITPSIRVYVEGKLSTIRRHFDHVIDVSVILSVDHLARQAEVSCHIAGKDIVAKSDDPDLYAAIDAVADKLDRQIIKYNQGVARSLVFDSLFARERLGSTGLGQGVAIPHGRIKGLKEAVAAFVRLAQPVPFDAPDGKPVSLVFLLLVPEQATEQHLRVLSELAQMFSDKALREAMSGAPHAGALHQLITAWQPDAAGQRRAAA